MEGSIPRVPGTAVFLTRTQREVPPVMVWHVRHNRALHERVFVLTVTTQSVPWVRTSERLTVEAAEGSRSGPRDGRRSHQCNLLAFSSNAFAETEKSRFSGL